jgi:hypothetical protein
MRNKFTIAAATAALATGGAVAAGAGASASSGPSAKAPTTAAVAATRHVEGRVTAIDRSARTFTVRDAERGTLKVKVTSRTKFKRVSFASLRTGTRVDVRAKRAAGSWNATKVERGEVGDDHDAGDDHGGDDGGHHGGGDDGANHS